MNNIIDFLRSYVSLLPRFSVTNILEIAIIAIIVYEILQWIMDSRAFALLKGIIVIIVFVFFAYIMHLNTILWLFEKGSTIVVIVLVVIFQPELRKALEQLGSQKLLEKIGFSSSGKSSGDYGMYKETAAQITKAVFAMAKVKTGALIVIERDESLKEFIGTGILINGIVSSGLLINIFEKNTPLHDGAVIIRGNQVAAATCYLPLSDNLKISKSYGTRHRAALGMSEVTDSVIIIVSEETGNVSVAYRNKLETVPNEEALDKIFVDLIFKSEVSWLGKLRREKDSIGI